MAHPEQQAFFEEQVKRFKAFFDAADTVLEVGSQDINGSVRSYFNKRSKYLGVDLGLAKGVDLVVPGQLLELPDGWADIAVTTECLEHAREWRGIRGGTPRDSRPSAAGPPCGAGAALGARRSSTRRARQRPPYVPRL